eukprot:CAMPEP_0197843818 /NCGR_PEP_ID=MMETSP1438-20131217/762_1 /TAXON_ID=1461541 /ORGANISM="Pterosperma sp., Strain CCMP1384" /LENGTH=228 /DNA_ID=CAMNT_0043454215 /DNA_START=375 /DNA_END=1061 /DNA_ORIENTATION=-
MTTVVAPLSRGVSAGQGHTSRRNVWAPPPVKRSIHLETTSYTLPPENKLAFLTQKRQPQSTRGVLCTSSLPSKLSSTTCSLRLSSEIKHHTKYLQKSAGFSHRDLRQLRRGTGSTSWNRTARGSASCALIPPSSPGPSDDESSDGDTSSSGEGNSASIQVPMPRRRTLCIFTCNACGERSERMVNPLALAKGTVYIKCKGCDKLHLFVDNLSLVDEIDLRDHPHPHED